MKKYIVQPSKDECDIYVGEITDFLDTLLIEYAPENREKFERFKKEWGYRTYLLPPDKITPYHYAIRVVGCTLGHIKVNDAHQIIEVKIYRDVEYFREDISEELSILIGCMLTYC